MDTKQCTEAKQQLENVRALKGEFDAELARVVDLGNSRKARELRQKLQHEITHVLEVLGFADIERLASIAKKFESGTVLTPEEQLFVAQVNSPTGTWRNGRIVEQIARTPDEITKNTKAYVGKLEAGIFQELPENIEHLYTQFPEKRIKKEHIKIGDKTKDELIQALIQKGVNIPNGAQIILNSPDFQTLPKTEDATLICLTVADLRFEHCPTMDEIFQRAQELGLELCPAETGPQYKLQYPEQPAGEWLYVGMKPLNTSNGRLASFVLGDFWLGRFWMSLDKRSNSGDKFAFRLRRPSES